MSKRFNFTPSSEHPGWWVLADTENNIVIRWQEHRFNDTQKVSVLNDTEITEHTATDLARIMREMGDYIARHHGGIAFNSPFGFEYSEDDTELFFCRYKKPKWRIKINENEIGIKQLANSLRKAAEYLIKRYS
ncbi:MAG: DNA breaking-rejoining protein [Prevotella sp.]|nr:DNA breaking-rejoining protein [Prevotella sp.]